MPVGVGGAAPRGIPLSRSIHRSAPEERAGTPTVYGLAWARTGRVLCLPHAGPIGFRAFGQIAPRAIVIRNIAGTMAQLKLAAPSSS